MPMARGSILVDSVVITRPSHKSVRAVCLDCSPSNPPGSCASCKTFSHVSRRPLTPLMKKQMLYTAEYDDLQCEDIQNVFTTCSQLRNRSIDFDHLPRIRVTPDATNRFGEEHHPPSNRDSQPTKPLLQDLTRRSSHRPRAALFRNRPSALRFAHRPSGERNQVSHPISIRCEFRPVCQPLPTGPSAVRLRQAS